MKLLVFIWVIGGLCAMGAALYLLRKISRGGASGGEAPPGKFSGWYYAPWIGKGRGTLRYGRIGEYVLGDLDLGTQRPVKGELLAMLPCGYRPKKAECVAWNIFDNCDLNYCELVFGPDGNVWFSSKSAVVAYKCKYHFEAEEERE